MGVPTTPMTNETFCRFSEDIASSKDLIDNTLLVSHQALHTGAVIRFCVWVMLKSPEQAALYCRCQYPVGL